MIVEVVVEPVVDDSEKLKETEPVLVLVDSTDFELLLVI
jgi:hypothetical protein